MIEQGTTENLETLAAVSWAIWGRRNALIFNKKVLEDCVLISTMMLLLDEFHKVSMQASLRTKLNHCWKRPHQGLYAINVDGAVSTKKGCSSVEMVIRDWSGKFCVGRAIVWRKVCSPLEIELLAVKEGFQHWV